MAQATDELNGFIDFGQVPEIYIDGIAAVDILGVNARLRFFTWQRIDGVFRKVIALNVIQPVTSIGLDREMFETAKRDTGAQRLRQVETLQ
jgi:hypothetical protein